VARTVQRRFYFTTCLRKGIFHTEISLQDIAIQRINSSGKKKVTCKGKKNTKKTNPNHVTDETV